MAIHCGSGRCQENFGRGCSAASARARPLPGDEPCGAGTRPASLRDGFVDASGDAAVPSSLLAAQAATSGTLDVRPAQAFTRCGCAENKACGPDRWIQAYALGFSKEFGKSKYARPST
eukprot:1641695-Pleurochrysis_carterae.AAC.3